MDLRDQRAVIIAAMFSINRQNGFWLVPSQSAAGRNYQVKLDGDGDCNCPDHASGYCCKHIRAVRIILRRELQMPQGTIVEQETLTLKKKYPRNHSAFNEAQAIEKHRVQELLHELLRKVPEPERTNRGRKPHSVKDAIFAMACKVYGTLSARRTECDLLDAHQRGFTSVPIPGMKVCAFFENPTFAPILRTLIYFSSLPLRTVETRFAVDSTGFSSSKYENWLDYKNGVSRRQSVWVKGHIACGVKTNVVVAVHVLDKDSADCPEFKRLLDRFKEGFIVSEVYADKAYLSGENIEAVFKQGGVPYIMFKENSTGGIGGYFEKMFYYFKYKNPEYLDHYHQRSNVESAFSMVKRKYGGDYVRGRTYAAMVNEVLVKFLVHNLCVLNQEQVELGIDPDFWLDKKQQTLAVAGSPG